MWWSRVKLSRVGAEPGEGKEVRAGRLSSDNSRLLALRLPRLEQRPPTLRQPFALPSDTRLNPSIPTIMASTAPAASK
jgi:hypothetical protein